MQKFGEDKAMRPAEHKAAMRIKYIGHKEAVYASATDNWPATTFKRGQPVEVGDALAKALLAQGDKFKEAG